MSKTIRAAVAAAMMISAGCFSFNFKIPYDDEGRQSNAPSETVLMANANNVYRFATNTVLRVKVQLKKGGKWVESDSRVLIPEGWYIVEGGGL